MSFFKKILSSVGIGSAKIDAILDADEYRQNDVIRAQIKLIGGSVEQTIDQLYFNLQTHYIATRERVVEDDGDTETEERSIRQTATISSICIDETIVLAAQEEQILELDIPIPCYCPLSLDKNSSVWLSSGLDIKAAIDPTDKDLINVRAGDLLQALLSAFTELGFSLARVKNKELLDNPHNPLPMLQQLEFINNSGPFKGKFDEIEVVPFVYDDYVEVFLEIDRKSKGISGFFKEALDQDESHVNFHFSVDEADQLVDMLADILQQHSD